MSDIEQILYPTVLSSLREDVPPVRCIIWKGGDDYESLTFDKVYPFDTIDDIKSPFERCLPPTANRCHLLDTTMS